jgi:hypothetical protein
MAPFTSGMASRRLRPGAVAVAMLLIIVLTASMIPVSSWAQAEADNEGQKQFSLLQGRGVPVCDAYLQLLNQAHFDVTPFCGRPDGAGEPGFMPLKREYWGPDQILPIFTHVYEFMLFDNQFHVQRWFAPNPANPNKPLVTTSPVTREDIADDVRLNWISVWSYEHPIDIENDGSPRNLLIWQGYGAAGGGHPCGSDYADHPWTVSYVYQRAFIINADGKTIDERLTRAIFGVPEESSPARSLRRPKYIPGVAYDANPFRSLAQSIGIFGYRGRYYIETENMPKTKDGPLPPVVVYLREHNHTAKVCAFRPENVPMPVD